MAPIVSICIPTYNGARFIDRALDSVAAQDYRDFEVVVVDDASVDGTVDRIKGRTDLPISLTIHGRNRGHNATWNETIACATGELVKFLHQDDVLRPRCLSEMVGAMGARGRIGMAFCRRDVHMEGIDPATATRWRAEFDDPPGHFALIEPVNAGDTLLKQWLAGRLQNNWVGEPSVVMVRRAALQQVGGFQPLRRPAHGRRSVAAADGARRRGVCGYGTVLAEYRYARDSLSGRTLSERRDWLDRLWILEGLLRESSVAAGWPVLLQLRKNERRWPDPLSSVRPL